MKQIITTILGKEDGSSMRFNVYPFYLHWFGWSKKLKNNMQSILLSILLSICFLCCSTKKELMMCDRYTEKCDLNEVKSMADCTMKKTGYELEILNREITESDTVFIVQYLPKDTLIRGGGGEIKISKKKCKVIEIKRYQ
ncbi:MAG TPA: hypothetical protein PKX92_08445 [Edaphocola sp.]|nr:hypothetical protein [Edaphocola sp.]